MTSSVGTVIALDFWVFVHALPLFALEHRR
jgi:hypothetical protein